jgi:hypothetical protein
VQRISVPEGVSLKVEKYEDIPLQSITESRLPRWLILYVGLLLVVSLFFLVVNLFPETFGAYTIYPFVLSFNVLKTLACWVVPLSTAIIAVPLFIFKIRHYRLLLVVSLLAATAFACCSRLVGLAVIDKQQASIQFENHIYNLISSASDLGPDNNYWATLYECDRNNFFCRLVFHDYVLSTNATLVPDSLAHTVTLQIDGETVYVHPVK